MAITGVDSTNQNMAVKNGNPVLYNLPTPANYANGNQTYLNSDIVGGIITHNATGASNGQMPTAVLIAGLLRANAMPLNVGDTIECLIINSGGGVLTLVLGAGMSFDTNGSGVIPANNSKYCQFRFTGVTPGAETCVLYS